MKPNLCGTGCPYGWAIIELNPDDEFSALDDWCENIRPDFIRALIGGSISDEWDRILMQKRNALKCVKSSVRKMKPGVSSRRWRIRKKLEG